MFGPNSAKFPSNSNFLSVFIVSKDFCALQFKYKRFSCIEVQNLIVLGKCFFVYLIYVKNLTLKGFQLLLLVVF